MRWGFQMWSVSPQSSQKNWHIVPETDRGCAPGLQPPLLARAEIAHAACSFDGTLLEDRSMRGSVFCVSCANPSLDAQKIPSACMAIWAAGLDELAAFRTNDPYTSSASARNTRCGKVD